MERTNTNSYELKQKGNYLLEIEKVIKKSIGKEGGKQFPGYEWTFTVRQCDVELDNNNLKMFMFKSQMGDILRAVGAKELSPGDFEWDMNAVKGKLIKCYLTHQDVKGQLRESLIEIKIHPENVPVKTQASEKAWDE